MGNKSSVVKPEQMSSYGLISNSLMTGANYYSSENYPWTTLTRFEEKMVAYVVNQKEGCLAVPYQSNIFIMPASCATENYYIGYDKKIWNVKKQKKSGDGNDDIVMIQTNNDDVQYTRFDYGDLKGDKIFKAFSYSLYKENNGTNKILTSTNFKPNTKKLCKGVGKKEFCFYSYVDYYGPLKFDKAAIGSPVLYVGSSYNDYYVGLYTGSFKGQDNKFKAISLLKHKKFIKATELEFDSKPKSQEDEYDWDSMVN